MNFSLRSTPAFLLLLAGAMGFGSLYSALFNTVGREILPVFFILIAMPIAFMYIGFYTYNFLAYNKGKYMTALILSIIGVVLVTMNFIGGASDTQIWFSFHEVLNFVSAWAVAIILALHKKA